MKILNRDCAEFLVIDDDPAITQFLAAYLKQNGHTCATLTEGFQTAAWLELHDCEVVVVDLNMPKVDGISLITYIREIQPGLPIIVFTGVGYEEERMHAALRAGANGYVSKNLPIEQLYCVLSRVLATCRQRARREALARGAARPARRGLTSGALRGKGRASPRAKGFRRRSRWPFPARDNRPSRPRAGNAPHTCSPGAR